MKETRGREARSSSARVAFEKTCACGLLSAAGGDRPALGARPLVVWFSSFGFFSRQAAFPSRPSPSLTPRRTPSSVKAASDLPIQLERESRTSSGSRPSSRRADIPPSRGLVDGGGVCDEVLIRAAHLPLRQLLPRRTRLLVDVARAVVRPEVFPRDGRRDGHAVHRRRDQ